MKKGILWILGCLALVLVIGGAWLLYDHFSEDYAPQRLATVQPTESSQQPSEQESEPSEAEPEQELQTAWDFTVLDADGQTVQLSDYLGEQPIIINFWASWCTPCQAEMPDFEAAYAQYGDEIRFMMVNLTDGSRETVEGAKQFIEEQGYHFPLFFDTEGSAATAYDVYSIPATYLINADGKMVAYASGMLDGATLQMGISMLLEE